MSNELPPTTAATGLGGANGLATPIADPDERLSLLQQASHLLLIYACNIREFTVLIGRYTQL